MKQKNFFPAELRIVFSKDKDIITTSEEYALKENETPLLSEIL